MTAARPRNCRDGLQGAFDAIKTGTEARTVLLPNG